MFVVGPKRRSVDPLGNGDGHAVALLSFMPEVVVACSDSAAQRSSRKRQTITRRC